jgi:hypothetical protein
MSLQFAIDHTVVCVDAKPFLLEKEMNRIMGVPATGFHHAIENRGTLKSARNKVR